jgi:hypothetical protein
MEGEIFVEVKVTYPKEVTGKKEVVKTSLFKLPWMEEDENLMIDLVAFAELVKAWLITELAPED